MRSTAGWVYIVNGAVTAYDSVTIKRMVTSSTEAECSALTIVGKENTWQRKMYEDLAGITNLKATVVHGDNSACISLLSSGVTKRTRHYSIDWFKVRELVDQGEMKVDWVPTAENLADFFTKKLAREKFIYFRDKLMGSSCLQSFFSPSASIPSSVPPPLHASIAICLDNAPIICCMIYIAEPLLSVCEEEAFLSEIGGLGLEEGWSELEGTDMEETNFDWISCDTLDRQIQAEAALKVIENYRIISGMDALQPTRSSALMPQRPIVRPLSQYLQSRRAPPCVDNTVVEEDYIFHIFSFPIINTQHGNNR